VIDGEHVDSIFTNEVVDRVRESSESAASYRTLSGREEFRMAPDALEAVVRGSEELPAQPG
jgi:hypothetical protein